MRLNKTVNQKGSEAEWSSASIGWDVRSDKAIMRCNIIDKEL